jgi:transglutaminase-like putative cysteine protease
VSFEQREDYFGNLVTDIVIRSRHDSLSITSQAQVDVNDEEQILLDLSPPCEQVAATVREPVDAEAWDAARFCFPSPRVALDSARRYAERILTPGTPFLRAVESLTACIYEEFEYQGGVTDVFTPVPDVLDARQGVCQDFAHLAIACLRAFGLPARYVSGYLLTRPPEGQPRLTGADASHAWFSVWCPEFGWVDFDPTNNLRPKDEHITLGWGRDYGDVSPTRGFIHGGGSQRLSVSVDVSPAVV